MILRQENSDTIQIRHLIKCIRIKKNPLKAGFSELLKLTLQQLHSDGQIDLSLQILLRRQQ